MHIRTLKLIKTQEFTDKKLPDFVTSMALLEMDSFRNVFFSNYVV